MGYRIFWTLIMIGSIIGGLFQAGGGLLSSAMGNKAQKEMQASQQKFNKKEAKANRKFTAKEAKKERDWQERMSSSAYQRQAADMEAAGLNKMMMYGGGSGGGASSGSGASASSSPATSGQGSVSYEAVQRAIDASVSSALEAYRTSKQMKLMQSQIDKTNAEKDKTKTENAIKAHDLSIYVDRKQPSTEQEPKELKFYDRFVNEFLKFDNSKTGGESSARAIKNIFKPDNIRKRHQDRIKDALKKGKINNNYVD
jgi:hypothetical protein